MSPTFDEYVATINIKAEDRAHAKMGDAIWALITAVPAYYSISGNNPSRGYDFGRCDG